QQQPGTDTTTWLQVSCGEPPKQSNLAVFYQKAPPLSPTLGMGATRCYATGMPQPLESRTALVTGASKGVGKGIALELARRGCNVAVNYHSDREGAEATVSEILSLGRSAFAVGANIAVSGEVDRMFTEVLKRYERLDILVNNAGTQVWKPLLDLEEAEWDRV